MMNFLKNLKVSAKLILSFFSVIAIFTAAIIYGYISIESVDDSYRDTINTNVEMLVNAQEIGKDSTSMSAGARGFLIYENDTTYTQFTQGYSDVIENLKKIKELNKDEAVGKLLTEIEVSAKAYNEGVTEGLGLVKAGNKEEGKKVTTAQAPNIQKILKNTEELIKIEKDKMNKSSETNTTKTDETKLIMVVFSLIALALGVLAALVITSLINKPLQQASAVVDKLSAGDLTLRAKVDSEDEIGKLVGQMNGTVDNLESMIKNIKNSASAVAKASDEISAGNQDLSQRTQEQAAALEETSSAIEELTSTVKNNADNAQRANVMSGKTKDIVVQGNVVVKETIQAMDAVTQSSKKISEIINVVNEIAFQTNLLALNAAVEAARAGEQGRGFAVVAVEVRNLAQRSAEAAKEIQTLINDSVEKIQNGNQLVLKTGETLDKITESIQSMADLVSEISAASHQQSVGIEEVNKAIVQMDQVTQQNASLVEEMAAASETMNGEAEELYSLAEQFKVTDERKDFKAGANRNHTHKGDAHSKKPETRKRELEAKMVREELDFDGFEKF